MQILNDFQADMGELTRKGFQVKTETYLRKGYDLFRAKPEVFIVYTILYFLLSSVGSFIVSGPLTAGFFIAAHRLNRKQTLSLDNMFEGFQLFLPLFLFSLISGILTFFGFLALILPGIYLAVAWAFAVPIIVFAKADFWEAMEMSRKLIHKEWFSFFGFLLVVLLINILGALLCGIGLLFTVPITSCAIYAAYEDIVGIKD